jgi:hypothetical protein
MEFGVDASIGYVLTDNGDGFDRPDVFVITLPIMGFRFGYFVTNVLSIEPAFNLQFASSDGDSFTDLSVAAGLLYHFSADPESTRPFVRVAPTVRLINGGDETVSQFGLAGQVGVKAPLRGGLAARLAVGVEKDFENDDFGGTTTIFGMFGLSFIVDR